MHKAFVLVATIWFFIKKCTSSKMWSLTYHYDQATGYKKPPSYLLMFEMSSLFSLLFTVSLWSFLSSCPLCLSHTQTKHFKADSCELPPSPTRGATSISEQLPRSQSCQQQTHIQLQWRLWLPAKRSWGPRTGNVQWCSVTFSVSTFGTSNQA